MPRDPCVPNPSAVVITVGSQLHSGDVAEYAMYYELYNKCLLEVCLACRITARNAEMQDTHSQDR